MEIDVNHVAELAKLRLSNDEARELEIELGSILKHVKRLFELDVTNVPPTFGFGDIQSVRLDEDIPHENLGRHIVLESSPSTHKVYFKVPRESGSFKDEDKGTPEKTP